MASRMKRQCTRKGCNAEHRNARSYCDDCERRAKKDRGKRYDKKRGSAASRGYGRKWQQARARYLRNNPICIGCEQPATVVDHVIPHRGDMQLFWDSDNWQPLCKRCHDFKTAGGK